MKAQKTDTTNRLKTLVQTKKIRPTHTRLAAGWVSNSRRKIRMLVTKNRFEIAMKVRRGRRATSAANGGWIARVASRVPV